MISELNINRYKPIAHGAASRLDRRLGFLVAAFVGMLLKLTAPALAHTEPDVVAVPAGEEAVLTLKPTHGCGDSSTTEVRIRAPLLGATAQPVEGWEPSEEPDGDGNTVLTWTGGTLPSDQEGAFPMTFTTPDTPGELLLFPAIQECDNGERLSWISEDPASEFPVPRILVLPEGYEAALTIEDVPLDAPGRDQLLEGPHDDGTTTTETAAPESTSTSSTRRTSAPPPTTTSEAPATIDAVNNTAPPSIQEDGLPLVGVLIIAGTITIAAAVLYRARK